MSSNTFTLDGKEIPFEPGDTIIRAAWRQGIEIPHYCWHPGLSIAANCRMCLVEIRSGRQAQMPILKHDPATGQYVPDTKPKLQPACQIPAGEGMEVYAQSEQVKEAQSSVQEFLLLNHPVDCPICDQAGECKLQDYWLEHQAKGKRKLSEPVHKPKGVRFGPTIVYDAERCIMCTRCIRVSDELAQDPVLDMRERGNKNEIVLSPGRELDHDYTLMTEHVCPVGALTSRDFRFKARVWFLKSADGVCSGCATGCTTHVDYDPRKGRVYRLRPRDNEATNQYWMCDDGMMTYKEVHENRVVTPLSSRLGDLDMDTALDTLAELLKTTPSEQVGVSLSALHSTEDNAAWRDFFSTVHPAGGFTVGKRPPWRGDKILRDDDHNPNTKGVEQVLGGAAEALPSGMRVLVALGTHAPLPNDFDPAEPDHHLVVLASNRSELTDQATLLIPVASWAESRGSYVNRKGLSQSFEPAIFPPWDVDPAWKVASRLSERFDTQLQYISIADVPQVQPPPRSTPGPSAQVRA